MSSMFSIYHTITFRIAAAALVSCIAAASAGADSGGQGGSQPLAAAAVWDDVRPPPNDFGALTAAPVIETAPLDIRDDTIRVWSDDFRPPPKGFSASSN